MQLIATFHFMLAGNNKGVSGYRGGGILLLNHLIDLCIDQIENIFSFTLKSPHKQKKPG